jgi:hypothetical protein
MAYVIGGKSEGPLRNGRDKAHVIGTGTGTNMY